MKESEAALPAPLSPTPQQRGSSDVGGQSEEGGHPSMHTKAGRRGRSQQGQTAVSAGSWCWQCWQCGQLVLAVLAVQAGSPAGV